MSENAELGFVGQRRIQISYFLWQRQYIESGRHLIKHPIHQRPVNICTIQ